MTQAEFEHFLDAISTCFVSGDIGPWQDRLLLPFSMVTKDGPVVLNTPADVVANFAQYRVAMDIMNVDQVTRRPIALEDCHDGTFIGTYETNLLSHGQRAVPPYTSSALLHDTATGWKMSSILNARGHHAWTSQPTPKKREIT
jgi:hypothetical protein